MFCSKCGAAVAEGAAFCAACGRPVIIATAAVITQPVARPTVAYAGFWLRFVALIIDSIVMSIITFPLVGAIGLRGVLRGGYGPYGGTMRPEDMFPFMGMIFRIILISAVLKWLYYALLE